jgi:D-beta-D-heptose 7-phosphate kinase/D-beta-D-heptose 1-phosphate adenosyltransferase
MKKILVIGESCTDLFEYGTCTRLNPEAPTPVFVSSETIENGGMAANVYSNIVSLAGHTEFEIEFMRSDPEQIIKHRFVDKASNYILLRVDKDGPVNKIDLLDPIAIQKIKDADLVVVSDYDKGFLTESDLVTIASFAKKSFIDTKKPIRSWTSLFSYIKINKREFENPANDVQTLSLYSEKIIVTLGESGAKIGSHYMRPSRKVEVKDVSGAGDTFLAALVVGYARTGDIIESIEYANDCSAIAVSHKGVVSVGHLR